MKMVDKFVFLSGPLPVEGWYCRVYKVSPGKGVHSSVFSATVLSTRELVFSVQEILAFPNPDSGTVVVVARKAAFQDPKFVARIDKLQLQLSAEETPCQDHAQMVQAIRYTMTAKLCPLWNSVGRWLVSGKMFLHTQEPLMAVELDVNLSNNIVEVIIQPHYIKLNLLQPSQLDLAKEDVVQFLGGDQDQILSERHFGYQRVKVLPNLTSATLVCVTKKIPENSYFQNWNEMRRYWKNMYGYRLVEDDLTEPKVYYNVRFFQTGTLLTYPEWTVRFDDPILVRRMDPKPCVSNFVQSVLHKVKNLCGTRFQLSQKILRTENQILRSSQLDIGTPSSSHAKLDAVRSGQVKAKDSSSSQIKVDAASSSQMKAKDFSSSQLKANIPSSSQVKVSNGDRVSQILATQPQRCSQLEIASQNHHPTLESTSTSSLGSSQGSKTADELVAGKTPRPSVLPDTSNRQGLVSGFRRPTVPLREVSNCVAQDNNIANSWQISQSTRSDDDNAECSINLPKIKPTFTAKPRQSFVASFSSSKTSNSDKPAQKPVFTKPASLIIKHATAHKLESQLQPEKPLVQPAIQPVTPPGQQEQPAGPGKPPSVQSVRPLFQTMNQTAKQSAPETAKRGGDVTKPPLQIPVITSDLSGPGQFVSKIKGFSRHIKRADLGSSEPAHPPRTTASAGECQAASTKVKSGEGDGMMNCNVMSTDQTGSATPTVKKRRPVIQNVNLEQIIRNEGKSGLVKINTATLLHFLREKGVHGVKAKSRKEELVNIAVQFFAGQ